MLDSDKKDHDDVSLLFRALQDGLFRFLKSSEQKTMFTCQHLERENLSKSGRGGIKEKTQKKRIWDFSFESYDRKFPLTDLLCPPKAWETFCGI
jgi:hypothetical protein